MKKGYSLVEVIVAVVLLSIIVGLGYRSLSTFLRQSTEISLAAVNARKSGFDQFIGVLNDRLGRAWSYQVVYDGTTTKLLLKGSEGQDLSTFTVHEEGTRYDYAIQDTAFNLSYSFTNEAAEPEFRISEATVNGVNVVKWKIPPPLYYTADENSFADLLLHTDATDLHTKVAQQKSNLSGLLQHDIQCYTWSPKQESFR